MASLFTIGTLHAKGDTGVTGNKRDNCDHWGDGKDAKRTPEITAVKTDRF